LLADRRASALHAFVRLSRSGAEVVTLGRTPITVGGERVERIAALEHGDRLELAGASLTVRVVDHDPPVWWFVGTPRGSAIAVAHSGFTIGSASHANLWLDHAEATVLTLHHAGQELWADPAVAIEVDGRAIHASELVKVRGGSQIQVGDFTLRILCERGDLNDEGTQVLAGLGGAAQATLQSLPIGGRLTIDLHHRRAAVLLPELRSRFFAALLSPPHPYVAGEFIPDELLLPLIWPHGPSRDHMDLRALVRRVRKTLLKAGIGPTRILETLQVDGVTRFRLAPGAAARVL